MNTDDRLRTLEAQVSELLVFVDSPRKSRDAVTDQMVKMIDRWDGIWDRLRKVEALVFGKLTMTGEKVTVEYIDSPPSPPSAAPEPPTPHGEGRGFRPGDRVLCGCQKLGTAEEKCIGTLVAIEGDSYEIKMDYGETVRHHGLSNLTPAPASPPAAEAGGNVLSRVADALGYVDGGGGIVTHAANLVADKARLLAERDAALRDLDACRLGRETFQRERDEARKELAQAQKVLKSAQAWCVNMLNEVSRAD